MDFYKAGVSVNVKTATNGFVVSTWDERVVGHEEIQICPSVQDLVNTLLLKLTTTKEQYEEEQLENIKKEVAALRKQVQEYEAAKECAKEAVKKPASLSAVDSGAASD